ncbi:serine protease [Acrasis kona]|uniref:Serine protease n=1 Tax=Acrasis kona TaxID=1008807 RepID=A0AAW2Z9S3_9EUKA
MEFGYYQNAVGRDQPFSKYISLPWFLNQCEQLFGVKNVDWTNQYYGQLDIKATNTIFANGNIDPWHKLGLLKGGYVDSNNVFFMNGTAHCADLYAPRDTDLESLKNTRARTLELFEKWL